MNLVAVVHVQAADESIAREVVPEVLGAPGTPEIRQANRNNLDMGCDAAVTSVDFYKITGLELHGRHRTQAEVAAALSILAECEREH